MYYNINLIRQIRMKPTMDKCLSLGINLKHDKDTMYKTITGKKNGEAAATVKVNCVTNLTILPACCAFIKLLIF